jgi:hypothetical protein
MAFTEFTGTWVDTTEQSVYAGRCFVTGIEVDKNIAQSAAAFIQLFDVADPTPGVTVPSVQVFVNALSSVGKRKAKFIFPGGLLFATACTAFVSTAVGGATAPLTTVLPDRVRVHYVLGG